MFSRARLHLPWAPEWGPGEACLSCCLLPPLPLSSDAPLPTSCRGRGGGRALPSGPGRWYRGCCLVFLRLSCRVPRSSIGYHCPRWLPGAPAQIGPSSSASAPLNSAFRGLFSFHVPSCAHLMFSPGHTHLGVRPVRPEQPSPALEPALLPRAPGQGPDHSPPGSSLRGVRPQSLRLRAPLESPENPHQV